jgi:hypothetical protein
MTTQYIAISKYRRAPAFVNDHMYFLDDLVSDIVSDEIDGVRQVIAIDLDAGSSADVTNEVAILVAKEFRAKLDEYQGDYDAPSARNFVDSTLGDGQIHIPESRIAA